MSGTPLGFPNGRLPDGWGSVPLGELLIEKSVRARDVDGGGGLLVLSLTKDRGLIDQMLRFDRRIARVDVGDYKLVRSGWIVYNPMVLWEGAIHQLRGQRSGLVSPVYATWQPKEVVDSDYLDLLLKTPAALVEYARLASGVVKRRRVVSKQAFLGINVPLPPLSEQRALASVLRSVQQSQEASERVVRAARGLKHSLLQHLLTKGLGNGDAGDLPQRDTDFGRIPAWWPELPLGACSQVQSGLTLGRTFRESEPMMTVPYLRVANVQDGWLDLREVKTVLIRADELERFRLRPGDVLLTEGGDLDKLGRGSVWRGEIGLCLHQNHIFAVRPDRSMLTPEYLSYLVQSPYGRKYFLKVAHRTTHLASINSTKLKALPVPLPSLDEQRQITSILSAMDRKIDIAQQRRDALGTLFKALLRDLMSARLRVAQADPAEATP